MNDPARRALTASTLALAVCGLCAAAFLPPMLESTLQSAWRTALFAALLGASLTLHWVWLASAARRLGGHVTGWLALSVLLFPVGSAASLLLLSGIRQAQHRAPLPA